MSSKTPAQVLETLRRLQSSNELSIIKLSEPISNSTPHDARQRISDASSTSLDGGPSPASLDADLIHYKELFAKLRFSYVEQVTKEKFIRAIVGDPPLIVTLQENLDLERENAEAKAQLKNLKLEVADMVADLEERGRELSKRYEKIQLETVRLGELPAKAVELENRIRELRDEHEPSEADPNLRLPLAKTLSLVSKRKAEQQELARELEALQSKVPRKRKEAERLQAELQPLEAKRQSSTTAAREARRRKEAALGGVADDLEQRARWWRASESMLRQVLDIET
ncbi:hypothetical protein Trco_004753 [Trichoderma cornu-damae]|uniref:Kinetochore protein Sos7 coiled-coil domain-containing protein n=1 Tax=Trichoderma cornu-damae TaxID=654480 RepID=A0A9P8QGD2_9HYPO|nr:hypothetical protein Trco_004753 [Trichoderma cornu-damae]